MDHDCVCANCGITIRWQPTIVGSKTYCCPGCAEGGPCKCDYVNLPELGDTKPMVYRSGQAPDPD